MKDILRKYLWPILTLFERGSEDYVYKASHRIILITVGTLFVFLSGVSAYFAPMVEDKGGYIPVVVFFIVGIVCLIVGGLGNERAIAKIWGSRRSKK